eukprot:6253771-Alexandrium_andersonii.AAC.1
MTLTPAPSPASPPRRFAPVRGSGAPPLSSAKSSSPHLIILAATSCSSTTPSPAPSPVSPWQRSALAVASGKVPLPSAR